LTAPAANENYKVNTHAEENGWDATGIQTACAILPQHENLQIWFSKLCEYRITALASPGDLENDRVIAGRKISEWITGYNIDSIGALGNHGAYPHPDYMAAPLRHTLEGALFFRLGGQEIPEINRFNYDLVYRNFYAHTWHDTSPIYQPDGYIFWPMEIEKDWRFEFITYGIIDLGAQILYPDSDVSKQGFIWEDKHTAKALEMNLKSFIAASAYLVRWIEFQEQ
jgi:hypothetical protein